MDGMRVRLHFAIIVLTLFFLTACIGRTTVFDVEPAGDSLVGPQEIVGATEVLRFDATSIPAGETEGEPGECQASSAVSGAYRCVLETDELVEPCFTRDGGALICDPDPVALTFAALVHPSNALPQVAPPPPDRSVIFFVELDTEMTCALRTTPEPVIIDGLAALYDCDTPYTYILDGGELTFDRSAPSWTVTVHTLDPETSEAAGQAPASVARAWIP
jgi:hypothetical protein